MGIYGNISQITALYDEYILAASDLGEDHEVLLKSISWLERHDLQYGNESFSDQAHQACSDLIIDVSFMVSRSIFPMPRTANYCCIMLLVFLFLGTHLPSQSSGGRATLREYERGYGLRSMLFHCSPVFRKGRQFFSYVNDRRKIPLWSEKGSQKRREQGQFSLNKQSTKMALLLGLGSAVYEKLKYKGSIFS